jgi:hypothetical protein
MAATVKRPVPLPPEWPEQLSFCLEHQDLLTNRELDFVRSPRRWRGQPTEKQAKWLENIYWFVYVEIEE